MCGMFSYCDDAKVYASVADRDSYAQVLQMCNWEKLRDGSLLCVGKGNEDWSCTAPHGSGRVMKRSEAKEKITLEEYRGEMKGIY